MIIKNVKEIQTDKEKLYFFSLNGNELTNIAEIRKFGNEAEGIGRYIDYDHAIKIREYFERGGIIPENIVGQLNGWNYQASHAMNGELAGDENSKIIITDGQHRVVALSMLSAELQRKLVFEVVGTMGNHRSQLKMAVRQAKRKPLDPRYILQVADFTDSFDDEPTKRAYQILKKLNQEKDSPLFESLWMIEKAPHLGGAIREEIQRYTIRLQNIKGLPPAVALRESKIAINVVSALGHLKAVLRSDFSPIVKKSQPEQYAIVKNLLQAAAAVWPEAWKNPDKFYLKRTQGIGALIKLITLSGNFREFVKDDWSQDNFRRILSLVSGFDWGLKQYRDNPQLKFPTVYDLATQLDNQLWQAAKKKRK